MLFSYSNAGETTLPAAAERFLAAAKHVETPTGVIIGQEAIDTYLDSTDLRAEIKNLTDAVTDDASKERVDAEIKRRVRTGQIPKDVAGAIQETVEILGLQKTDLSTAEIPLIAVLYTDAQTDKDAVVINIVGTKALADALRLLWSKVYTSPYPSEDAVSAVAIYRMPPVEVTAHARQGPTITVDAVKGWGRFVGTDETGDAYTLKKDPVSLERKEVREQATMIARNQRTGEVVKTTPPDKNLQKLTDEQARSIAADLKRIGEEEGVFGVADDRRWLLRIPSGSSPVQPVEAPVEEEDSVPLPKVEEDEAEVEIVELEDGEDEAGDAPEEGFDEPPEERVEDGAMQPPEPPELDVEEELSASASYQQAQQLSTAVLMQCLKTVELVMREWLYEDEQPDDFGELVELVASKRVLPYKQRLLSLWEMKREAAFEEPDADKVRFALETMERFIREF